MHRVEVEVDPELEVAEIADRQSKEPGGGKALWFSRVKGSRFPLVTNLFGAPARLAAALGVDHLDQLSARMERLLDHPGEALAPCLVHQAPCQEVLQEPPDLFSFPFLKSWPEDGGRFITLPLVVTRDPETGADNLGMYRVRLFDPCRAGIRWKPGSGGHGHYQKYQAAGRPMPVAIAVGGDPVLTLAAALPLPQGLDELSLAGYLRGEAVPLVRCKSSDLLVPADAELVIEGVIEPGELLSEGPFGNHTGSYHPGAEVPVLRVTCVTHRAQPVCLATVVGKPPMEDCWLAVAAQRLLLPLSRRLCPEIVDVRQPLEGIFHGCTVVSIKKRAAGQGRRVLERLHETGWLKASRLLVVVDAEAAPLSLSYGLWRALNEVRLSRDLLVDGEFLGVDATVKWPGEGGEEQLRLEKDAAVEALVTRRWKEYGFCD
ncbi:hypothetical protein GMLC_07850 [Geomonas limicola]|uniref:Menaquinone biosynthesis decarboxylase n=1 Tax=Geomonas limicola TaxID=2740186 RepID=A0A6V8N3W0_9BACT|nr:hypothetical protein GMLC_07850 [Geomonas limicola]